MTDAIQAVPLIYATGNTAALAPISQLAQRASSLFIVPSVILSLGTAAPLPITYNAAGLFAAVTQVAGVVPDTTSSATEPSAAANALAASLAAAGHGATTVVGNLASFLDFSAPATGFGFLNAAPTALSLPTASTQTLLAQLSPDAIPASDAANTLTVNQSLARQTMVDLYASATGLDSGTASTASGATDILQGLLTNGAAAPGSALLLTNLGLPAAALLDGSGMPATTTSSNGSWVTTIAPTPTPSTAADTTASLGSFLDNLDLAAAATTVVSSGTTSTPAKIVASADATPAPVTSAAPSTTATPAAAESAATTIANASPTATAATGASLPAAAGALSNSFLQDAVAQALANIDGNPAYASSMAGLYMSAAIFHSQQAATAAPNIIDRVTPVSAVPIVGPVKPVAK